MFVNESKLRHVLPPEAYFSEDQYRRELDRVLLPGWHFVTTMAELKRDGDYVTLELFGKPLLVRRWEGEPHAYLNVCAHRHCLLTGKAKGHDPAFRCQYHGWEYRCDGRTAKIPDASSFRPFDRENARLVKFRTERCGDLVFVNLSEKGPSLEEQLAEKYDELRDSFTSPPYYPVWSWEPEYPTNWKVAIENLLESYHIPSLHPRTFVNYPPEENIVHEMNDRWTTFYTEDILSWVRRESRKTARALGLPFKGHYTQHHIYPNLVFILMDVVKIVKGVVPISPTRSRAIIRVYSPYGPRRNPIAWISARLNAWAARIGARKILEEDACIFKDAQRGIEASTAQGVIGRREERVWAFQDWILRHCGGELNGKVPLPMVAGARNGES